MKLFNLTYEKQQFVSSVAPTFLPEDNFSFIEIEYENDMITSIKGIYIEKGERKECILSDIDISSYKIPKKIEFDLEFIKDEETKDKIKKIFILSLSKHF